MLLGFTSRLQTCFCWTAEYRRISGTSLLGIASKKQLLWLLGWIAADETNFFEILAQFPFFPWPQIYGRPGDLIRIWICKSLFCCFYDVTDDGRVSKNFGHFFTWYRFKKPLIVTSRMDCSGWDQLFWNPCSDSVFSMASNLWEAGWFDQDLQKKIRKKRTKIYLFFSCKQTNTKSDRYEIFMKKLHGLDLDYILHHVLQFWTTWLQGYHS